MSKKTLRVDETLWDALKMTVTVIIGVSCLIGVSFAIVAVEKGSLNWTHLLYIIPLAVFTATLTVGMFSKSM